MYRLILLLCLLCSTINAQQTVNFSSPENKFNVYTPIEVKHEVGQIVQVIFIDWETRNFDFLKSEHFVRYDNHTVWSAPPGKYMLSLAGNLTLVEVVGNVPTPIPNPDNPVPGPTPDIPDDDFNNIGKRVYGWSKGNAKQKELAQIYASASEQLNTNPSFDFAAVVKYIVEEKAKVLVGVESQYSTMLTGINSDLQSRWPLNKYVYADWLLAVSKGLK